jgi:hypothetical protein
LIKIVHFIKNYFIEIILYSTTQAYDLTFTVSHTFFHKIAFQIGESLEIFGNSESILLSLAQTIL